MLDLIKPFFYAFLCGFNRGIYGRGLSNEAEKLNDKVSATIFSKGIFVAINFLLVFFNTNHELAFYIFPLLQNLIAYWLGTGLLMVAFTKNIDHAKKGEFILFDFPYNHLFCIKTERQAQIKSIAFGCFVATIQYLCYINSFWFNPLKTLHLAAFAIFSLPLVQILTNFITTKEKWLVIEMVWYSTINLCWFYDIN